VPAPPAPKPPAAPVTVAKPQGPSTTPSPPAAEPKAPAGVKIETTDTKPSPGVHPAAAARRLLSDTLPSPIAASSLRPEPKPTTPTEAKPTAAPAEKTLGSSAPTVPAVPTALSSATPPKPSAGRTALSSMKADAPQPAADPAKKAPTTMPPPAPAPPKVAAVAPAPVEPAPVSGPPRVGGIALESIDALADLPTDVHRALVRAATVEELAAGDVRVDFGAALVLAGEVSVFAAKGEGPGQEAKSPAFVPSRGSLAQGVELRLVAGSSGATIARWTSDFFEETLRSCSWVLDDCHVTADRLQARAGLTLGALAQVDAQTRDRIADRLEARVVEPGEVVTEENGPMPGIVFIVGGSLELVEGDAVVGELHAGEPLFPDALWAGAPAPLTARAAANGALLLVGDRRSALELADEVPIVNEILSR